MDAPTDTGLQYPTEPCRGCGAQIIWAVAEQSLRSIPIDPQPVKNGNIQLLARQDRAPLARSLKVAERATKTRLYQSHFASCPKREQFRRAGRNRAGA